MVWWKVTSGCAAQEPSGYLNTNYVGDKVPLRFTEMYRSHELYCLGHMLQAGIAYYRATGNRRLTDIDGDGSSPDRRRAIGCTCVQRRN
jgi:DUF1680 family protein